jgi:hypothetical protein
MKKEISILISVLMFIGAAAKQTAFKFDSETEIRREDIHWLQHPNTTTTTYSDQKRDMALGPRFRR